MSGDHEPVNWVVMGVLSDAGVALSFPAGVYLSGLLRPAMRNSAALGYGGAQKADRRTAGGQSGMDASSTVRAASLNRSAAAR